jgi:hypothetical protein
MEIVTTVLGPEEPGGGTKEPTLGFSNSSISLLGEGDCISMSSTASFAHCKGSGREETGRLASALI